MRGCRRRAPGLVVVTVLMTLTLACGGRQRRGPDESTPRGRSERVVPGITVLLDDSIHLVQNRRIGLITNQTGIDQRGVSDIDLLATDPRARRANAQLAVLFSPEHGIRGTEDRQFVESGRDAKTGLLIHSLYTVTAIAPPDSTLHGLDVLIVDLQDIGTRTWTYVGVMVYAMRAAARRRLPILVLDRPNPVTGARAEGALLDAALANAEEHSQTRAALPYALYPMPLRHGMTIGELARFYNGELSLGADLHVIPMKGWRRMLWFDQTGLPWVRPSPNMPSLTSAILYPAIVPFEGSPNVSVGRGTPEAFQRIGASWLRAKEVADMLNERDLAGVRFEHERFRPQSPTDGKYAGREIPGVRIIVTDRDRVQAARIGAALLWAIGRTAGDSLRINARAVDLRLGSTRLRESLLRGDDPEEAIDRELASVVEFGRLAKKYQLYR